MSDEAKRKQLLDRIQEGGADGGAFLRRLYADAPIGRLEAIVALIDEARANASKPGDLVTSIGERVKLARTTLQLTQAELARRLGLSQGYISAVENGRDKANIDIVVGMAMFFPELNPDWLLTGRGQIPHHRRPARRALAAGQIHGREMTGAP